VHGRKRGHVASASQDLYGRVAEISVRIGKYRWRNAQLAEQVVAAALNLGSQCISTYLIEQLVRPGVRRDGDPSVLERAQLGPGKHRVSGLRGHSKLLDQRLQGGAPGSG